jgi:hypothetical protein
MVQRSGPNRFNGPSCRLGRLARRPFSLARGNCEAVGTTGTEGQTATLNRDRGHASKRFGVLRNCVWFPQKTTSGLSARRSGQAGPKGSRGLMLAGGCPSQRGSTGRRLGSGRDLVLHARGTRTGGRPLWRRHRWPVGQGRRVGGVALTHRWRSSRARPARLAPRQACGVARFAPGHRVRCPGPRVQARAGSGSAQLSRYRPRIEPGNERCAPWRHRENS